MQDSLPLDLESVGNGPEPAGRFDNQGRIPMTRCRIFAVTVAATVLLAGCFGGAGTEQPGGAGTGGDTKTGGGGGHVAQSNWIFPGTLGSAAARDHAVPVLNAAISGPVSPHVDYPTGWQYANFAGRLEPFEYESPGAYAYGYWNPSTLSSDITKIQRQHTFPDGYGNEERVDRTFGILSGGVFSIERRIFVDDFGQTRTEVGATSDLNEFQHSFYMEDQPDIFHLNATWTGDALGWQKSSLTPVYGPAEMKVSSTEIRRSNVTGFNFNLNVDWSNGDRMNIPFLAVSTGDFIRVDGDHPGVNASFFSSGAEAIGVFETNSYLGSFGVKQ